VTVTDQYDSAQYPAGLEETLDLGHRHFARPYVGLAWIWWHDCPAVGHISWGWIGNQGDGNKSGHVIESTSPLTVRGSLVCTDCRDHGFIRDGRWVPA